MSFSAETAIVTDSVSQMTPALAQQLGIIVVPATVVVDGTPYLEGAELSAEEAYERLASGASLTTAAPSPGQFAKAYEEAALQGATSIVSVHTGSNVSGTFNSARLVATAAPIPVHTVDTRRNFFSTACCVLAAAEAAAGGASAEQVAVIAKATKTRDIFVVGQPSLVNKGGRVHLDEPLASVTAFASAPGAKTLITVCEESDPLVLMQRMADYAAGFAENGRLRIGVGDVYASDRANDLERHLRVSLPTAELTRYGISPSIASHMGVGTVVVSMVDPLATRSALAEAGIVP